jgi:hypothetical protein
MLPFSNDETGYLQWVDANPSGFVINVPKQGGLAMLHKARCPDISTRFKNYTTSDYMKLCSLDRQELVDWKVGQPSKFQMCKHCKP